MKSAHTPLANSVDLGRGPTSVLDSVQTGFYLLAFSKKNELLSHFSENCGDFLRMYSADFSTIHLETLFPASFLSFCRQHQDAPYRSRIHDESLQIQFHSQPKHYQCHLSITGEHIIVEFEEHVDSALMADFSQISWMGDALESLNHIESVADLAAQLTSKFRTFSAFDRVVLYRFDHEFVGEIIGQDGNFVHPVSGGAQSSADGFQVEAGNVHSTSLIRIIHDADDPGVHVRAVSGFSGNLDPNCSVFHKAELSHIRFLQKSGVKATHSHVMMVHGRPWGILVGHHLQGPRSLGLDARLFFSIYLRGVEKWIESNQIRTDQIRSQRENKLLEWFKLNPHDQDLFRLLESHWQELSELLQIDAFSVSLGNGTKSQYPESVPLPSNKMIFDEFNGQKHGSVFVLNRLNTPESGSDMCSLAGFQILPPVGPTVHFFRASKTIDSRARGDLGGVGHGSFGSDESFSFKERSIPETSVPWSAQDIRFVENMSEILRNPIVIQRGISKEKGMRKSKAGLMRDDSNPESNSLLSMENQQLKKETFLLNERLDLIKARLNHLQIGLMDCHKLIRAKSELVENLSHEMRDPLHGILGFAQILQSEQNPDVRDHADHIIDRGQRLLLTIDNLLRYAQESDLAVARNTHAPTWEELVHSVIGSFDKQIAEKRHQVQTVIHNRGEAIIAERLIVEQILLHLVGNAIEFTPEGGNIRVQSRFLTEGSHHFLKITVEDDGVGIPEYLRNRMFDPFFTVKTMGKDKEQVTGLGLYLIKSYVSMMRGTVDCVSSPGNGSLFTVTIPVDR